MSPNGLFIGLITLDLIYLADNPPQANQKLVARDSTIAAGGPATNAGVTFSYLGGQSTILGVLGKHAIAQLIKSDICQFPITVTDLAPDTTNSPPVSSIIVTQSTGERAVISLNAVKTQATIEAIPPHIYTQLANHTYQILLIDGHQIPVSRELAQIAKTQNIPVVIDAGSWKPGLESLLHLVDYAVCSSNFYPPGCQSREDVFTYLQTYHIPHIAITCGEKPIQYLDNQQEIHTIPIPPIHTVDTLGAGDIFHGAFSYYILNHSFPQALTQATQIAAKACSCFGTRKWMDSGKGRR